MYLKKNNLSAFVIIPTREGVLSRTELKIICICLFTERVQNEYAKWCDEYSDFRIQ